MAARARAAGPAPAPGFPPAAGLIDAHHHVWALGAFDQPWLRLPGHEPLLRDFTEAELRPQARAAGVAGTVVIQTVTGQAETPALLALAAASDLVGAVVGWADLSSPAAAAEIAALRAAPGGEYLRGLRHPLLTEPDPGWLLREEVQAGLAAAGAAGLSFDLVLTPGLLPACARAAAACPQVTFILDHLGNPDAGSWPDPAWAAGLRALAALPNTACKLSGILGAPAPGGAPGVAHLVPWYETALGAFGPGRLMFGSDWPVCTLTSRYADVVAAALELTAGLSPPERAEVLAGTARRVYRIAPPG